MADETIQHLETRTWAVTPSQYERAFGVPVFRVLDGLESRETAVTPLSIGGEVCDMTAAALCGFRERPTAFATALGGLARYVPLAVQDNFEAFVSHKRLRPPAGAAAGAPIPADLDVGVVETARLGRLPATLLATLGGLAGVLTIARTAAAVHLEARWVQSDHFVPGSGAFIEGCRDLEHEDFLAGLATDGPELAVRGVAELLKIERRALPNQVAAAMLHELRDRLPAGSPSLGGIERILATIGAIDGFGAVEGASTYASSLATLRQLLLVLVKVRRTATPAQFDAAANLPTWRKLMDTIIDTTAQMCRAMDGEVRVQRDAVDRAIRNVAAHAEDDFARGLPTGSGRLAASLAALALKVEPPDLTDLSVEGRFSAAVQLVGESGWILARPYEHGLLATVMHGW